jgi:hypothetical protein
MQDPQFGSTCQPFPAIRPEIIIEPSTAERFAFTSAIIPGWGVPVAPDAKAWMAWYDLPDWSLTSATWQHVVRAACIHGVEGFEVEMRDWEKELPQWQEGMTQFVRLTEERFEWLAISRLDQSKRLLYTFLDEGFDEDWGPGRRRIEDVGRLMAEGAGYTLRRVPDEEAPLSFGAGMFRVCVGENSQDCLREISIECDGAGAGQRDALELAMLAESYYTQEGRLFLFRRYNGRMWKVRAGKDPWDVRLPGQGHLVINGAHFVHWYDCLTDICCPLRDASTQDGRR